jgi:[protein-PII] uridylyltransferase
MAGGFAELRTQLLSRTGVPGPARRRALARLTDGWLGELAQDAGVNVGGVALVAVGGYGRGELSPFSDLDLVLLHSTETPASYAGMLAERLWYPIWDSKIRLDHSVRSVGGARQIARTDLPAMLGMLDLRHIAGDPELAVTLHRRVLADWRSDAKNRLEALRASCQERAQRSGELAFATTPDLKESRGGLRDLVVMRAVAASWVADCPHQGLEEARSALLDVRDVVQTLAGRSTDRLQVQDQDSVAELMGLDDRDVLLKHVAGIARTVDHASDLTWHRVDRALSRPQGTMTDVGGRLIRRIERTPLADGIVEQEGEAVLARAVNPATDPTLVLRAAAAAAQAGLPVSPATVLRLAKTCPPLPEPWPPIALDAFLALLGAGEPMIPAWEDLDQAGLISTLLPGWERLRSMPQRDPIHRYTVDRHLMETAVVAAGLVRRVSRPDLLLLAAILHDIGKGHGADYSDHSVAGAELSVAWLQRMGVDPADIALISTLIRHHLLLAESASKRDPDDPATIAMMVDAVGDSSTLDLLWALTEADARAAGPAAWTTWRAGQINHLVGRVRRALAGEQPAQPPAITEVERQLIENGGVGIVIEQIPGSLRVTIAAPDRPGLLAAAAAVVTMHRLTVRAAAVRTVDDTGLQTWTVAPQFGEAPAAATLRADLIRALDGSLDVAARLARRTAPARRSASAPPEVQVIDGASESSSVLEVRAHDTPGLLFAVASALTTLGISVVSARVHTVGAEAVDVFYVRAADGTPLSPARGREVAAAVAQALA